MRIYRPLDLWLSYISFTLHFASFAYLKCCLISAPFQDFILLVFLAQFSLLRCSVFTIYLSLSSICVAYSCSVALCACVLYPVSGVVRYMSISTSVNFSTEINFANPFFVYDYHNDIGRSFSITYSSLSSILYENISPS